VKIDYQIDVSKWPVEARQFEEIISAAVRSFGPSNGHRRFEYSRSACEQLAERIEELGMMENQSAALDLVRNQLGERDCLAICFSVK
jgi:hypothetical protein